MEKYLSNFKNCLQKEPPFCVAECPFHLNVIDFIEKMKRGDFNAAFKTYRNAVGFPLIVSHLCHAPCKDVCPRGNWDKSVELQLLEKACVAFTGDRSPTDYNLPIKKRKVAIIGAGPSGLACALRLCTKKYEVEIFEANGRIGGCLWDLMPESDFLRDINEQFRHESYTLHLNTEILTVNDLQNEGYSAVYLATGKGGNDFGLLTSAGETEDKYCARYGNAGWFAGGGIIGDEPVHALARGLNMGTIIDNFLKTDILLNPDNKYTTKVCLEPGKRNYIEPSAAAGSNYSEEEARNEAARCIECQCDACRTYCDLTDFYNKWPLRIRDEIVATVLPGSSEVKATPARRLINTCSQCGLCREVCPEDIDLGMLILEGRRSMHAQKKMPWAFHDFWLRDMDFSNGEKASVTKAPPKASRNPENISTSCSYAFFPGCQLGASAPALVEKSYRWLLEKQADTGLFLRCCGAPAEWSGDDEKHQSELEKIRRCWEDLGRPILIMACPTCQKKFREYMPDIRVLSLYEVLDAWGIKEMHLNGAVDPTFGDCSIFDPCASINEPSMQEAVRKLARQAGCALVPLENNEKYPRCCGYGGQPGVANPEYVDFVVQKRIQEGNDPYVVYCINCRDAFREAGKSAIHILELLFGRIDDSDGCATVTERRRNRIELKRQLMKTIWDEEIAYPIEEEGPKVHISPVLANSLSKSRILEEDIIKVIEFCEESGRRTLDPQRGTYRGYREVGNMTYWVEYKRAGDLNEFELVNAYGHRMKIELEQVWNGYRIEKV